MYTVEVENFTDEIPDSDAKIYMTLDDIINIEQIQKPSRAESVKSFASRRSARSNKSARSTYSNKSRQLGYPPSSFGRSEAWETFASKTILLKKPGQFAPRGGLTLYKNRVRQAVNNLRRGGIKKNKMNKMMITPNGRFLSIGNGKQGWNEPLVKVQIKKNKYNNSFDRVVLPLTKSILAKYNRNNKSGQYRRPSTPSVRSGCSFRSQASNIRRHSVHGSCDANVQSCIKSIQEKRLHKLEDIITDPMNFVPTCSTTGVAICDRFSHYD